MSEGDDGPSRSETNEELGRAVIGLIREEPFFGHLLSGINRKISAEATRVSVSFRNGRPTLSIEPEYFLNELELPGQRSAAIKQVTLATLLKHRARLQPDMDPRVFALASDIVVNQMMGDRWPLPPWSATHESFSFPLPPDMTLEWYYGELFEHQDEIPDEMLQDPAGDDGASMQDEQEQTIGEHELAKAVRDARDRSGDDFAVVPEVIQALVEELINDLQPTVDWRRVIRLFAASSRRTRIANTLRRPSKRYGTYPGIKVKRLHRLAVIIDTSGSVQDGAFSEFFTEVHSIWRQGSQVTIVEADNQVRSAWDYLGSSPEKARGRGGTNFDPALQWLNEAKPRYDAAVYFTDGKAAAPKVRPPCDVLWVLPPDGDERHLRGQRIVRLAS